MEVFQLSHEMIQSSEKSKINNQLLNFPGRMHEHYITEEQIELLCTSRLGWEVITEVN